MEDKTSKRVRVTVHKIVSYKGNNHRVLVFDKEADAQDEHQLRKRAEAKMGKGLAVMSISRFERENNNGKKGEKHE